MLTQNKKIMKPFQISILLLSISLFFSCSKDDVLTEVNNWEIYEKERAAWEALVKKNYQFTYYYNIGFGVDHVAKIAISENQEPRFIEKSPLFSENAIPIRTISDIYDLIDEFRWQMEIINAIRAGNVIPFGPDNPFNLNPNNVSNIKSMHLSVTYNTKYHYPQEVIERREFYEQPSGYGGLTIRIIEFIPK